MATMTAMRQSISVAEYTQRRSNLVAKLRQTVSEIKNKTLVVVLRSAVRQFYAPDVPYPFHQCSYFRYFTGLNQPDAVLVITAGSEQKLKSILYVEGIIFYCSLHLIYYLITDLHLPNTN